MLTNKSIKPYSNYLTGQTILTPNKIPATKRTVTSHIYTYTSYRFKKRSYKLTMEQVLKHNGIGRIGVDMRHVAEINVTGLCCIC